MRYQKLVHMKTEEWVWVRPVTEEEKARRHLFYMDYQTNVLAPNTSPIGLNEVLGVNISNDVVLLDEFIDDPLFITLEQWKDGKHD